MSRYYLISGSCLFALVCFSCALFCGDNLFSGFFNFANDEARFIFWQLRLPRATNAFVTGGLLAASGCLMQLLLENPLADPYTLGTSSAAAFFALLFMFFGMNQELIFAAAALGSVISVGIIFTLAKSHHFQKHSLLLAGIALAYGFSAGVSFLLLMSPATQLHSMLFWLAGDFNDSQLSAWPLLLLTLGLVLCGLLAPGFNLLLRGESAAQSLGLNTKYYRLILFLLSAAFTAVAVTLAGCISFIGLLSPHFARKLVGFNYRLLLPLATLLGGALLTLADTLARNLFYPQQISVGIITAGIGVPIYIWLIKHEFKM